MPLALNSLPVRAEWGGKKVPHAADTASLVSTAPPPPHPRREMSVIQSHQISTIREKDVTFFFFIPGRIASVGKSSSQFLSRAVLSYNCPGMHYLATECEHASLPALNTCPGFSTLRFSQMDTDRCLQAPVSRERLPLSDHFVISCTRGNSTGF